MFEKRLKEVEFQLARVQVMRSIDSRQCDREPRADRLGTQANKASALARLGEETAACNQAAEIFNLNEMQQVSSGTRAKRLF